MAANEINVNVNVTGTQDLKATNLELLKSKAAAGLAATQAQKLDKAFSDMSGSMTKVQREMRRVNMMQQQSGKASRRMELGFQQAGYQFQDLVVQLQGGVNPFVAISQQGSQLASFFAGPWGAMIGLGIAALGALGTTLMATGGKVRSLDETLRNLQSIEEPIKELAKAFSVDLDQALAKLDERTATLVGRFKELKVDQLVESLKKEVRGTGGFSLLNFEERLAGGMGAKNAGGKLISDEERDARVKAIKDIFAQLDDSSIQSEEAVRKTFRKIIDDLDELSYVSDEWITNILEFGEEKLGVLSEEIKTATEKQEDLNDAVEEQIKLTEKLNSIRQDSAIDAKKAEAALLEQNGFKTMAMQLEKDIAAEILRNKALELAEGKALTQEQQNSLEAAIKSAQQAVQLKYELALAKDEAAELAKALAKAEAAMNALKNFGLGLKTSLAQAKAEALALSTGADVATAKAIAGKREQLQQRYESSITAGADRTLADAQLQSQTKLIDELERVMNENAAETKRQRDAAASGKKGASDQAKFDEYIKQLQRELQLKIQNTKLTDEQTKREEFMAAIREKGIDLGTEATDKQMASVMKLYDKTVDLQRVVNIVDVIENNLVTAMMNVVDGTMSVENAFKSMLRSIILEIYKQEVASSAAKGISGFIKGLFMADGGVFSGGKVTPFANGGVVGGPTMFPMSNGVGLMGEAGPEAIMPLKRGSDGKLGVEGGGGVTVVQNINISTGVQQTVRSEIRQLMPQIAESAKSAVLDGKRRGGSYGRSFA